MDVEDLNEIHKSAWFAARAQALEAFQGEISATGELPERIPRPSEELLLQRSWWQRQNRPLESHHDYGLYPWNNRPNSGVLWARMLFLKPHEDVGLCYFTFGIPDAFPLGTQRVRKKGPNSFEPSEIAREVLSLERGLQTGR